MSEERLPSWNDGAAKSAILDFVVRVTTEGGPDFVPLAERIATFDNDGTLWCEQPMQPQVFFLIDRVKQLAASDPSLKERQPYKALLENDMKALHEQGKQGLMELAFATHAGMSDEAFDGIAKAWFASAKHPKFGRPFQNAAPTSRRSNCSPTCAPTASRPSSCRAEASISSAPSPRRPMAFRASR